MCLSAVYFLFILEAPVEIYHRITCKTCAGGLKTKGKSVKASERSDFTAPPEQCVCMCSSPRVCVCVLTVESWQSLQYYVTSISHHWRGTPCTTRYAHYTLKHSRTTAAPSSAFWLVRRINLVEQVWVSAWLRRSTLPSISLLINRDDFRLHCRFVVLVSDIVWVFFSSVPGQNRAAVLRRSTQTVLIIRWPTRYVLEPTYC